jgi:hypothetical protein
VEISHSPATWTVAKASWGWLVPVLAISAAMRLVVILMTDPFIAGDTPQYLRLARQLGQFDLSGDIGQRTPLYPLFMLVFRYNTDLIRIAQMVLALIVTVAIFYVVLTLTRRPAAAAGGAALYGLSLFQIRMESYLLSEALTTLLLALVGASIVWLWSDRTHRVTLKLVALVSCAGLVPLARPAYAYVPFVAFAVALSWAPRSVGRLLLVAVIAFLPMLAWSTFNLVRVESFGLSTGLGLNLTNKTGSYIEDAPQKYAVIRDLYLRGRAEDDGQYINTIWRHYESMMQVTGLSFNQLSDSFLSMNLELIATHPLRFASNVASAYLTFFKIGVLDSKLPRLAGLTYVVFQVERWLGRLVSATFLLLVVAWVVRAIHFRTWRPITPLFWLSFIVLAVAAICAVLEYGDNQRFGMPTQPLMFAVVVVASTGILERFLAGRRAGQERQPASTAGDSRAGAGCPRR